MANIPEYSSQQSVGAQQRGLSLIEPTERGSNAIASSGRAVGALARAAGEDYASLGATVTRTVAEAAETYVTNREVLKFTIEQADYMSAGILGWKKFAGSTDITDPKAVEDFNKNLEKQDEAFLDGYVSQRGREMALQEIRRRRDHMSQVQLSDIGTRTGEMAVEAVVGATNKYGALVQRDPTALNIALGSIDQQTKNLKANPALSEEQRAGFEKMGTIAKRNIAKTAFLTMAQNAPVEARAELEAGWQKDLLTPEDRDEMLKLTQAYERANEEKARAAGAAQEKANKDEARAETNRVTASLIQPDGSLAITPEFMTDIQRIAAMPGADDGTVRAMLTLGRTLLDDKEKGFIAVTDPDTAADFRKRMMLPANDPSALSLAQIATAFNQHKLSEKEFTYYKTTLEDLQKDPAKAAAYKELDKFLAGMKPSITASNELLGRKFPMQDFKNWEYERDMTAQFEAVYRSGGDWRALIDPRSPKFLGQQVGPYQLSTKEGLQTYRATLQPNAPAPGIPAPTENKLGRKPGETIEQYNKRISGG